MGTRFKGMQATRRPRHPVRTQSARTQWSWLESLCVLLVVFNFFLVIGRTALVEIDMWDSWAVWAFKAKIYFTHRAIPFERFGNFSTVWGNWDYPHHVPLMEAWVMLWLDRWDDQLTRLVFPAFYIGLCGYLYCYAETVLELYEEMGTMNKGPIR